MKDYYYTRNADETLQVKYIESSIIWTGKRSKSNTRVGRVEQVKINVKGGV